MANTLLCLVCTVAAAAQEPPTVAIGSSWAPDSSTINDCTITVLAGHKSLSCDFVLNALSLLSCPAWIWHGSHTLISQTAHLVKTRHAFTDPIPAASTSVRAASSKSFARAEAASFSDACSTCDTASVCTSHIYP